MSESGADILLVDDSLTVRMDLSEALETAQLRVVACTTVAEAQSALSRGSFGLIILDVILPDGDGVDLLEQIRENPALNGVAVILLSDEAHVRDRIRGLVTGADEYIGKPYDAGYVVACAQDLLRRGQKTDPSSQETILVVDDSITFCEQMKEALEEASYRVLIANSGEAGLRLAANLRPSAIIVDRTLPGIDGVTVLRRIRMDAALQHTPCILLTASEDKSDEIAALDAGADAFVRKDEDIAIILARLEAVVRNTRDGHAGDATRVSLQGPKRILVVDADEEYRGRISAELRAEGYEIVQAHSGEDVFDLLSAQSVDCILLDLDVTGIGSHETCRRIKAVQFSSATPIIMTAARDDRDALIRSLAAGADDYISKSSDFAVLRARVLAQIRRKQFEDENRRIQKELALKEIEAAETRAVREAGEMRERMIDRYRSEIALGEFYLNLAQDARWSAMAMITAQICGEITPALAEIATCLNHARRTLKQVDGPQTGHLLELIGTVSDRAAKATGAIGKYQTAVDTHCANRTSEQLNGMVQEIVSLGIAGGWNPELEVRMDLAPALPPVTINKAEIQQVLAGLIRNALGTMKDRQRQELTVATHAGKSDIVCVTVTDTGGGVPAPESLFVPSAPAQNEDLALKIFRSILERHDGRIWAAKGKQGGTTVTFELPAAASEQRRAS